MALFMIATELTKDGWKPASYTRGFRQAVTKELMKTERNLPPRLIYDFNTGFLSCECHAEQISTPLEIKFHDHVHETKCAFKIRCHDANTYARLERAFNPDKFRQDKAVRLPRFCSEEEITIDPAIIEPTSKLEALDWNVTERDPESRTISFERRPRTVLLRKFDEVLADTVEREQMGGQFAEVLQEENFRRSWVLQETAEKRSAPFQHAVVSEYSGGGGIHNRRYRSRSVGPSEHIIPASETDVLQLPTADANRRQVEKLLRSSFVHWVDVRRQHDILVSTSNTDDHAARLLHFLRELLPDLDPEVAAAIACADQHAHVEGDGRKERNSTAIAASLEEFTRKHGKINSARFLSCTFGRCVYLTPETVRVICEASRGADPFSRKVLGSYQYLSPIFVRRFYFVEATIGRVAAASPLIGKTLGGADAVLGKIAAEHGLFVNVLLIREPPPVSPPWTMGPEKNTVLREGATLFLKISRQPDAGGRIAGPSRPAEDEANEFCRAIHLIDLRRRRLPMEALRVPAFAGRSSQTSWQSGGIRIVDPEYAKRGDPCVSFRQKLRMNLIGTWNLSEGPPPPPDELPERALMKPSTRLQPGLSFILTMMTPEDEEELPRDGEVFCSQEFCKSRREEVLQAVESWPDHVEYGRIAEVD
mmetsp:Transcript_16392/g.40486  ORF Transcript_16392/g.40486 Transcript_16392/m.40486 type:complete len:649 (+) Transcript_16392:394-2340(+)|eukprot:CAMPEP_0178982942 /NCGR_PEP_ID=MMETSP0795-20121207/776_1 /TAXON_ID=88552 /ORGANISM="Amoebophrya sp., Strain Ameob2" /LENGTH=648 /DNA_ID=CAMNT_0020673643 /DNA_START=143 /DNA_END=2089 /DNA_ORIENTATION=+